MPLLIYMCLHFCYIHFIVHHFFVNIFSCIFLNISSYCVIDVIRKELVEKKEAIRAAKRAEQQRRVAEKKALQEQIVAKNREKEALMAAEAEKIRVCN